MTELFEQEKFNTRESKMKFMIFASFIMLSSCLQVDKYAGDDKRKPSNSVQSLPFDWEGLSDKFEQGSKFKDVN